MKLKYFVLLVVFLLVVGNAFAQGQECSCECDYKERKIEEKVKKLVQAELKKQEQEKLLNSIHLAALRAQLAIYQYNTYKDRNKD